MKETPAFLKKKIVIRSRLPDREALSTQWEKSIWFIIGCAVLTILYVVAAIIFPFCENTWHILSCILLMTAASFADIQKNQIPAVALGGYFVINIVRSAFFIGSFSSWVIAAVFSAVLFGVHLIKKNAIGTGDIMMLGLGISSLAAQSTLPFLFLSFLLSSLYGIVLLVVQKNRKTIAVPMAPCITIAWITGLALFS
ncbi:MAG: hypothetical protein GX115_05185 [Ruminiclostridium sp.]|nr:hypothetical protein [Ruminiclostridium sp.]